MDDINQSIDFAINEADLDICNILIAQPNVGTDLRKVFIKEHLMRGDDSQNGSSYFCSLYDTTTLKGEEIAMIKRHFVGRFVWKKFIRSLNPFYLIRKYLKKICKVRGLGFVSRRVVFAFKDLLRNNMALTGR